MERNTRSQPPRRRPEPGNGPRLEAKLRSNDETPLVDKPNLFERLAEVTNRWIASTWGLVFATAILAAWLAAGPLFGWERSWYYVDAVIASATFVFVFLLQRAQRKDSAAIHTKLNELLAAVERASPRLINLEDQSEEEVDALHDKFQDLQENDSSSHSIEECVESGPSEVPHATREPRSPR